MTVLPLIVFDVNETLLDLETMEPTFQRIFGDKNAMRLWFANFIMYSAALTVAGCYVPFTDIGSSVMKMLADTQGIKIADSDRKELTEKFSTMPPHAEVPAALRKLRDAGFRLFTLTDNLLEVQTRQLEHGGIVDLFERRFSADGVKHHKPSREAYAYVERELGVEPSQLCLIACHTWDTLGAVAAGWEAALIKRVGNDVLGVGPQPQIVGDDLDDVAELKIFYREAGPVDAPALLLLHGFPSASHMFRDLIPLLADRFHIVAPDLPGFGQSDMPARSKFAYTFDHVADVIDRFTEVVGLERFSVYVFDYGAPTGFRIAVKHPDRITAIISQNGNAYEEGLSEGWNPIRAYWQEPSQANRDALRTFLAPDTTRWQYTHGVSDETTVAPDGLSLDNFYLARPGADEVQLDLFGDYKSNVSLYPTFQKYFRTHTPPLLAVWGRNDPFFLPPGAEAFKRDIPGAVVRFFDTGHFALETHASEIAAAIRGFLAP